MQHGATVYLLIFNWQHKAPFSPCHIYSSNESSVGTFGVTKAQAPEVGISAELAAECLAGRAEPAG